MKQRFKVNGLFMFRHISISTNYFYWSGDLAASFSKLNKLSSIDILHKLSLRPRERSRHLYGKTKGSLIHLIQVYIYCLNFIDQLTYICLVTIHGIYKQSGGMYCICLNFSLYEVVMQIIIPVYRTWNNIWETFLLNWKAERGFSPDWKVWSA